MEATVRQDAQDLQDSLCAVRAHRLDQQGFGFDLVNRVNPVQVSDFGEGWDEMTDARGYVLSKGQWRQRSIVIRMYRCCVPSKNLCKDVDLHR